MKQRFRERRFLIASFPDVGDAIFSEGSEGMPTANAFGAIALIFSANAIRRSRFRMRQSGSRRRDSTAPKKNRSLQKNGYFIYPK